MNPVQGSILPAAYALLDKQYVILERTTLLPESPYQPQHL